MKLFWWGAWALTTMSGVVLVILRSAENSYSSVSLPRLLYMMWLMACVLVLVALRHVFEAAVGLGAALVVGALTFVSSEAVSRRQKEIEERLRGARQALKEDPENGLSMELIGDVCSTLEHRDLALSWYEKAYALIPNAKLLEKLSNLKRSPPVFHIWGNPCARELRLCPSCETLCRRGDYSCRRCGEVFFAAPGLWRAAAFNGLCDEYGVTEVLESGVVLLPFLFACGPLPYGFCWLVWAGARRPRVYSVK
ncbi:MAG: hypothetical protein SF051_11785 [Elusimicrobiota bacterium]|nr:hypothetical protein [Elusimicrobiota bacterium]